MPAYNKFNNFVFQLGKAIHNLDGTHVLKVMLTNTAPAATNSIKSNLTEISAGNGYTAGGTATTPTWSIAGGTAKLVGTDVVFTASGGSIGPFRYAALYNDTAASDDLISWWDHGASITLNAGETFTVDFDATNGILQLS